jgi:hypothetical protein
MKRSTLLLACIGAGLCSVTAQEAAPVDFLKQVKPILESSCTHCHGAEKQKGDLAVHTLEACLKGGENGPAIVAGDAAKSPLYTSATLPAGDKDIMPPSKDGPPLEKNQTDVLAAWIAGDLPSDAVSAGYPAYPGIELPRLSQYRKSQG